MRLIDADELLKKAWHLFGCDAFDCLVYREDIDNMPTIDPVKHGHWNLAHCCSRCGEVAPSYVSELHKVLDYDCVSSGGFEAIVSYYETDWCPHCGALMDEVIE